MLIDARDANLIARIVCNYARTSSASVHTRIRLAAEHVNGCTYTPTTVRASEHHTYRDHYAAAADLRDATIIEAL